MNNYRLIGYVPVDRNGKPTNRSNVIRLTEEAAKSHSNADMCKEVFIKDE